MGRLVAAEEERGSPHPVVAEVTGMLRAHLAGSSSQHFRVCHFGLGEHTAELDRGLLADDSLPAAHIVYLRGKPEILNVSESLAQDFPRRVHADISVDLVGDGCSVLILAVEDPRFHAEDIRAAAKS